MSVYVLNWNNQPADTEGYILVCTKITASVDTIQAALKKVPKGDYDFIDIDKVTHQKRQQYSTGSCFILDSVGSMSVNDNQESEEIIYIKHYYNKENTVEWENNDKKVEYIFKRRALLIDSFLEDE